MYVKTKFPVTGLISIFLIAIGSFSAVSSAGEFTPLWRGMDLTVYAEWSEWNYTVDGHGNFRFSPDDLNFGAGARSPVTPRAVQLAAPISGSPVEVLSRYNSRNHVLKLNDSGLYVELPNFQEGTSTRVRFEICYSAEFAGFSGFTVSAMTKDGILPGYNSVFLTPDPVQSKQENGWTTAVYEFTIEPSPWWENLTLEFDHYPDYPDDPDAPYVDSFSFDTICVPEPASVALLTLGAFLIRRKWTVPV